MAVQAVNIRLFAKGAETVTREYSKSTEVHHTLGGGLKGNVKYWPHTLGGNDANDTAIGELSLDWKESKRSTDIIHDRRSEHLHYFRARLGVSAFKKAVMRVIVTGKFRRVETIARSLQKDFSFNVNKNEVDYQYFGDMFNYSKDWDWASWGIEYVSGEDFLVKLSNSSSDPNATASGTHLWIKYTDSIIPEVSIEFPLKDQVLEQSAVRPLISGAFADVGSSIDINSFELRIEDNVIKNGDIGLSLDNTSFSYAPSFDLKRTRHQVFVSISDMHGNIATSISTFSILDDNVPPSISNFQPSSDENIQDLQPTISANFNDSGVGVNTSSFQLRLDGNIIPNTSAALNLIASSFTYTPESPLSIGKHSIIVSIRDNSDNIAVKQHRINILPVNITVGDLDVQNLDRVGSTTANLYNTAGINTIKNLSEQDYHALSVSTGIAPEDTLDHVNRALLIYAEFKLLGNFPAPFLDRTIEEVLNMDDATLDAETGAGLSLDEKFTLRKSLGLLVVCLDDSILPTLRFGDFVN